MATMTAVYDVLKAVGASDEKATAAVEAIEVARDEPWKRKTETGISDLRTEVREGFARLETKMNALIVIAVALLVPMFIKAFLG